MSLTDTPWPGLLKFGTVANGVAVLHDNLRNIFEYWGDKYSVPNGRLFSFTTKKAVEHFQRRVEIPVNGQADKYTWEYLNWALSCYDAYYISQAKQAAAKNNNHW